MPVLQFLQVVAESEKRSFLKSLSAIEKVHISLHNEVQKNHFANNGKKIWKKV